MLEIFDDIFVLSSQRTIRGRYNGIAKVFDGAMRLPKDNGIVKVWLHPSRFGVDSHQI
jgi:hypothetical protein